MLEKPEIKVLQPGDETALEAFLLPRVASSMFLLGNMRAAGLEDEGEPYQGTYAAAFSGGKIVSVVAHYWNDNLILQAPVHLDKLWGKAVEVSGRPVGGLIGPSEQVDVVNEALDIGESRIQLDETERLYTLALDELVVPDALASGQVVGRRAEPRELDLLVAWRVTYGEEALGESDTGESRERARSTVERLIRQERTWVLEVEGEPVACSSFNTATEEAVQVGGVWTPADIRSRGYGRAVVAASLLDARAEGVTTAILFTGQENVPAQRAYAALGFQHVGAYRMLLLNPTLENGHLAQTHS
jgi:N-acetylglutamate synthase-like GNAT family acetyltransferase